MPDLTLSFTNPHILDDVSFHPCVRYNRFEQQKVISFVPPDGAFKLMSYRFFIFHYFKLISFRVKGQLQIPLYVKPQITFSQTGGKVHVMVGPKNTTSGKPIENVVVIIPFPKIISSTSLSANYGQVQYDDIAKVKPALKEFTNPGLPMGDWEDSNEQDPNTGGISFSSTRYFLMLYYNLLLIGSRIDSNPVIQAEWKVDSFAASGLKVDSLALHNEKYKPFKGVKSITKSGKFFIRS
jgi:AP-3 complex subunit mu